ncbi:hypothetical protein G6F31_021770 [Rhizopus arrhizus]|nr:hypothetical protein G6F31_021770 [Rhizopus arrhizus]
MAPASRGIARPARRPHTDRRCGRPSRGRYARAGPDAPRAPSAASAPANRLAPAGPGSRRRRRAPPWSPRARPAPSTGLRTNPAAPRPHAAWGNAACCSR